MDELRVLIAEPEGGVARLLEVLMGRRGFVTERAVHGGEVMPMALAGRPDLIILDPVMSVVEGDEVLRRLKTDEGTAGIPIVLVATNEVLASIENNGHVHLNKPFDVKQLSAAVDDAMAARVS